MWNPQVSSVNQAESFFGSGNGTGSALELTVSVNDSVLVLEAESAGTAKKYSLKFKTEVETNNPAVPPFNNGTQSSRSGLRRHRAERKGGRAESNGGKVPF